MKWEHWIRRYIDTHCTARGLLATTLAAYEQSLQQLREWVGRELGGAEPDALRTRDLLAYVEHLRRDRGNGDAAVSRHVVILRNFYRAMVALGDLDAVRNPAAHLPRLRAPTRKLPVVPRAPELRRLLHAPEADTVLGLRDRALLALLYGTGMRASECSSLRERDVDLGGALVHVRGKGGHERVLPLNRSVVAALEAYRCVRGERRPGSSFFVTRLRRPMTRGGIYERVRTWARRARIPVRVSPHRLRHAFATHLVQGGVGLVTIRDLLGHRQLTSTQLYLHVTAQELREAADRHPIARLAETVASLLPGVQLPLQRVPPPRTA